MLGIDFLQGNNAQARILIVDDEPHIRTALVRALRLNGYAVDEADSGPAALELLAQECFDLMVLDMRMPGMDGVEVMQRTRHMRENLDIIVLTGYATVEGAIAAVKSSAVDFLQKPVKLQDLGAAVHSALHARAERQHREHLLQIMGQTLDALRKPPVPPAHVREVSAPELVAGGSVVLDRQKRTVTAGSRTAELTEGEEVVLATLMAHPDRVLSCRQMARLAWDYDMDELEAQSLIRPYIFRLRRKIEINPDRPRIIHTVRGRGYLYSTMAEPAIPGPSLAVSHRNGR